MVASQEFWRLIINDFQPVGPVRPEHVKRFFVVGRGYSDHA
jgi:hypothetical protein